MYVESFSCKDMEGPTASAVPIVMLLTIYHWCMLANTSHRNMSPGPPHSSCLCSYNIFGPEDSFPLTDAIAAWDDCLAEFDARKATTATPDMKMVVSMSFGGNTSISLMADALTQTANERSDVLFVAAAGNSGINDTSYPAGYPEVVSGEYTTLQTVKQQREGPPEMCMMYLQRLTVLQALQDWHATCQGAVVRVSQPCDGLGPPAVLPGLL